MRVSSGGSPYLQTDSEVGTSDLADSALDLQGELGRLGSRGVGVGEAVQTLGDVRGRAFGRHLWEQRRSST